MTNSTSNHRSKKRQWLFRLLAIGLGLLPLLLLELVLVAGGWGKPDPTVDPFVGFVETIPLFELNDTQDQFVLAPMRRKFFAPEQFPAQKQKGTFRIFCLGGSTVQGRPYSLETSFTTWLQIALSTADPETSWEVVNCGGISYASYRLVPILLECLEYEPDLFIICTGHNEFLEDRSYGHLKDVPRWLKTTRQVFNKSRTVTLASRLVDHRGSEKNMLTTETQAMLDYQNGIAAYHRDLEWNDNVAEHFESNLRRMVTLARQANVPVLLMQPCSNLRGVAPFKSESVTRSESELQDILDLQQQARQLNVSDVAQAVEIWQEICEIDPEYALNWYELGRSLELLGRLSEARNAYVNARDLDICPLRMTSPLESRMQMVVKSENVSFLNLHEILEQNVESGILGNYWLVDHVHPSFAGHQQIGLGIARWMEQQSYVKLSESWQAQAELKFQEHFEALPRTYFHQGQRMLDALRDWTQGNADGPPAEEKFPHRFSREASDR